MGDSRLLRIAVVAALFVAAGCVATNLATAPGSHDLSAPPLHPAIGRTIPVPPSIVGEAAGGGGVVISGSGATPYPTGSASPTPMPCNGVWWYSPTLEEWLCMNPQLIPGDGWGVWVNKIGPTHSYYWGVQPDGSGPVVNVQAKPNGSITQTLSGIDGKPLSIAGDTAGNVYVTAFPHNSINVYAGGSSTPTSSVIDIGLTAIYYIATDHNGNLFADGWGPGGPGSGLEIDEFPAGSQTAHKLITIPGKFPGGIAINSTGTMYVADEGNGSNGLIESLKPPYNRVSKSFSYNGLITGIDLDKSGKHIWAANLNAGGADVSQEYSVTGTLLYTSPALPAGTYSFGIAKKK